MEESKEHVGNSTCRAEFVLNNVGHRNARETELLHRYSERRKTQKNDYKSKFLLLFL